MLQPGTICTSWKRKEKEKTEKGRKRKALEENLIAALLMESNASRERAEQIQKKDIPAQDKEIKKIEEKIKKID